MGEALFSCHLTIGERILHIKWLRERELSAYIVIPLTMPSQKNVSLKTFADSQTDLHSYSQHTTNLTGDIPDLLSVPIKTISY